MWLHSEIITLDSRIDSTIRLFQATDNGGDLGTGGGMGMERSRHIKRYLGDKNQQKLNKQK